MNFGDKAPRNPRPTVLYVLSVQFDRFPPLPCFAPVAPCRVMPADRFPLLISVVIHAAILGFASWKTFSMPIPRGTAQALSIDVSMDIAGTEAVFSLAVPLPDDVPPPIREVESMQRSLPPPASAPTVELADANEMPLQVLTRPRMPTPSASHEESKVAEVLPEQVVLPKRTTAVIAQPPATSSPPPVDTQFGLSDEATPPRLQHSPPPAYPVQAVRSRWQGVVLLEIDVAVDGSVRSVRVSRSSGYTVLDEAAITAVGQWRFIPATRGGSAVASTEVLPIRFRL